MASGSVDTTVKIWGVTDSSVSILRTLRDDRIGHVRGPVWSLTFSQDGSLLVSGCGDGSIKVWDPRTGSLYQTLRHHQAFVRSVSFTPDGGVLASASGDHTVMLWNVRSVLAGRGGDRIVLTGHTGPVTCVRWNSKGTRLASSSRDMSIKVGTRPSTLQHSTPNTLQHQTPNTNRPTPNTKQQTTNNKQ